MDMKGKNKPGRASGSDSGKLLQLLTLCHPVRVSRATGAAPRPWSGADPHRERWMRGSCPSPQSLPPPGHPLHLARAFPCFFQVMCKVAQLQFPLS